ncbi:MAG: hypothetical protein ABI193_11870 [Minicystis sp.]
MARLAPSIKSLLDLPDRERRLGPFYLIEQLGRGGIVGALERHADRTLAQSQPCRWADVVLRD